MLIDIKEQQHLVTEESEPQRPVATMSPLVGFSFDEPENPSLEGVIAPSDAFLEAEAPNIESSLISRVADNYFRPRKFEESGRFYEMSGIRFFKKWLPTTGNMVNKHFWKRIGRDQGIHTMSPDKLRNREANTRVLETMHLGMFALYGSILAVDAGTDPKGIAINVGFNLGTNVYPIMLQRYNRVRLNRVIKRAESREERLATQAVNSTL